MFELLAGSDWTLFGYEVDRERVPARAGLSIHTFGAGGDLIDDQGHFKRHYGLAAGEWVLVRPDGYLGALVSSDELEAVEGFLLAAGAERPVPLRTAARGVDL